MHGYTHFWGLQGGLFGNPVGFPYQILGYFACRWAKNLIFGVENQVFWGLDVLGVHFWGFLKGLKNRVDF